ncbi:MAG: hypothetical protein KDC24_14475 [Saprospiraceae bacterium]|nr:hypothetical protein [Saprospiraceae bacterium]
MKRIPFLFVLILFAFSSPLFTSCEGPPKDLSIADKKKVDSLYRDELKSLRSEMDSICRSRRDSLIQTAVDSLLEENIQEITRQLQRIKNLQEK